MLADLVAMVLAEHRPFWDVDRRTGEPYWSCNCGARGGLGPHDSNAREAAERHIADQVQAAAAATVDAAAERVHEAWIAMQWTSGKTSCVDRHAGEELMVPWGDLSEWAKDLDRSTVRAVLGLERAGETSLSRGGRHG
jgi:hypothetical protein